MAGRWSARSAEELPDGLILFDGVCVLCSYWVRFVDRRDAARRFRFVPIQSAAGQALAGRFGIDPAMPETNAVTVAGQALFKSDAALAVLGALPGWRAAAWLRWLPRPLRDALYDRVAGNRYRWFGRMASCPLPPPGLADRVMTDWPIGP